MPVQINDLQGGIGIEFIVTGIVTGKEIIEANEKIYDQENLQRLKYKIVDRTNCTEYGLTTKEVKIVADQDKKAALINFNIIMTHIATTPLQYGVSRMWQAYVEEIGFQTEIFKDRKSADNWLEKTFV